MLTELRLVNFKSWTDTGRLRLAPITGLFGANSSGKTSILQSLLALKQTSDSSDRGLALDFGDKSSLVNLGDFQSVVHRHSDEAELSISLSWEEERPFVAKDPRRPGKDIVRDTRVSFSTSIRGSNGKGRTVQLSVPSLGYRVGDVEFGMRARDGNNAEYDLYAEGSDFQFVRGVGRAWPLPPPVRCYGFPDQVRAYFQNAGFLSDLELALEENLRKVFYLGPLRAYPERQYTWAGAQPSDMGRAGEDAVKAILFSRERGEKITRASGGKNRRVTLEAYLAEWLQKLGLIEEFSVKAVTEGSHIFQVHVKKTATGAESLITDVGFGVSQILPVVVLCFYAPIGSTVILEQPEIHLHPAVQAGLADVLIDAYQKRKIQVLVESHSEYLLRRLQRRIAEEKISADETALYFCEAKSEGSSIRRLQLDLFGQISNWPKDFFGDAFGEIAATQAAILRRKQARS